MKNLTAYLLSVLLLSGSLVSVQASTDILVVPDLLPLEEDGEVWEHPEATITGEGELKIEDGDIDVVYEGALSCDVSVSAPAEVGESNEVEITEDVIGVEVEAESKVGTISVSNCTITDSSGVVSPIGESLDIFFGKVEVEIEEFRGDLNGNLVFSEYEVVGKVESGKGPRVKLELENGKITTTPTIPPPCIPPDCGGGF